MLFGAATAHAQVSRVGGVLGAILPGSIMRGSDVGHDPANDVFLVVVGHGPVYGVFANTSGALVSPVFTILPAGLGWGHFPRVKYSPHISDGAGGFGGFLVTWHNNCGVGINCVWGRLVSYSAPTNLVSDIQLISDGTLLGSWHETGPAMAYSKTSQKFLVAWRSNTYAIQGRFVDTSGTPLGPVMVFEAGTSRNPSLTWNPFTDEFGLAYTGWDGGPHVSFRRIRAGDGFVSPRTVFGYGGGTFDTATDMNTRTKQYVVSWAIHPGTSSAVLDSTGAVIAANLVTTRLGFDQSLGMAFNPASGTSLIVSSDIASFELGAVELNADSTPTAAAQVITSGARVGSNYPMTASTLTDGKWNVVYARDFGGAFEQLVTSGQAQIVLPDASGTPGGFGVCPGCSTTSPATITSGGTATLTPLPASSAGCSIPDPFTSLGGGTCVNGGWLPPGMTAAPSAPAPAPATGCSIPDPFTSIGGGICRNGGWIPKGMSD